MAKKYLTDIDLNKNQLQNAVVHALATAPSSGVIGQIYYNTTDKNLYQHNGTTWVKVASGAITSISGTAPISVTGSGESRTVSISAASGSAAGSMSSAHYTKLEGIAAGAEVNQNAFSNVKVGSTTVAADGKTDTLELAAGTNITLTPDATNDKVTIATTAEVNQNAFSNVTVTGKGTLEADSETDTLVITPGNNISMTVGTANDTITIAATDTTYDAGTQAQLESGSDTTNRVWQPKIIHDYVSEAIGAADAMRFKGTIGTGGTVTALPSSHKIGDTYRVITAGTYAGQTCEIGDLIIALGTSGTTASDWTVAQTNIDGAITAAGTGLSKSGTTLNHSNSVSAQTTQAVYPIKIDAQGHISAYGSAVTSMTPSSHTHGNIQNGGTLQSSDITIASGDKLVVTDSSDSSKIARTSVSFDGSTTTKALTPKGTFETFLTSHQTYTQVPGKPTGNQTPGFGSTFTISQISQATSGQISATDRTVTIPSTTATTSAAGLMSTGDKQNLDALWNMDLVQSGTATLTAGQTDKTISLGNNKIPVSLSAYDSSGNEIVLDVYRQDSSTSRGFVASINAAVSYDITLLYTYVQV